MTRTYTAAVSLVMIAAALLPIRENFRKQPRDGFPLSYYPMFARKYRETQTETYAVGLDEAGQRRTIPHRYIGPGGGNEIRKQIAKMAGNGGEPLEALCRSIAVSLGRSSDPELVRLVELRIVRGEYRVEEYFGRGIREPISERFYCTCRIERSAP